MNIKNFTQNIIVVFLILGLNSCSSDSDSSDDPIEVTVTTSDFTTTIDENPATGQVIGTVNGTTNQGSVSFSITEQTPSGAFTIDSNTGELVIGDELLFDFETNPIITGVAKVANGDVFSNSTITITIIDIEESNVFDGDVVLHTQDELNELGSNNYTNITGYLLISSCFGNEFCPISDLSPLSSIGTIGGFLTIFGDEITNLDGLNILSVDGIIGIDQNQSLVNLDGLSSITASGGLNIGYNPLIVNLDGLVNIVSIEDNINILGNDNLNDVNGLINILQVGGELDIRFNDSLDDLCGIRPLLLNNGLNGDYLLADNAYNPSQQDILDGNCSQ